MSISTGTIVPLRHLVMTSLVLWFAVFTPVVTVPSRCSWTGSGDVAEVSGTSERSVVRVRLSCDRGTVLWERPLGALHVTVELPASDDREICIRLVPKHSPRVTLFAIIGRKRTFALGSEGIAETIHCFEMVGGSISFLLESKGKNARKRFPVGGFDYEITPKNNLRTKRDAEVNGDCSEREILNAFCSADFVFTGTVEEAGNSPQVNVLIEKVIRLPMIYEKFLEKSLSDGKLRTSLRGTFPSEGRGVLRLFIARTQLGIATSLCAPLASRFERIARRLGDNAPCQLI